MEDGNLDGRVSAISFNNVFYVARKQLGRDAALEAVKLVRRVFGVLPVDETVIDRALAAPGNDFEDAIQAATAIRAAADYVVTRNIGDFVSLGIPSVTAEEMLAIFQPS